MFDFTKVWLFLGRNMVAAFKSIKARVDEILAEEDEDKRLALSRKLRRELAGNLSEDDLLELKAKGLDLSGLKNGLRDV